MNDSAQTSETPTEMCRLIYKSDTSWDLLNNELLQNLATTSADNNRQLDITGLLALSGEHFLQVLEGPSPAVNALYRKIIVDKRHESVRLLSFESITRRQFSDWSMNVVDLDDLPMHHRKLLAAKYQAHEDGYIEVPDDPTAALSLLLDARVICISETERC